MIYIQGFWNKGARIHITSQSSLQPLLKHTNIHIYTTIQLYNYIFINEESYIPIISHTGSKTLHILHIRESSHFLDLLHWQLLFYSSEHPWECLLPGHRRILTLTFSYIFNKMPFDSIILLFLYLFIYILIFYSFFQFALFLEFFVYCFGFLKFLLSDDGFLNSLTQQFFNFL